MKRICFFKRSVLHAFIALLLFFFHLPNCIKSSENFIPLFRRLLRVLVHGAILDNGGPECFPVVWDPTTTWVFPSVKYYSVYIFPSGLTCYVKLCHSYLHLNCHIFMIIKRIYVRFFCCCFCSFIVITSPVSNVLYNFSLACFCCVIPGLVFE